MCYIRNYNKSWNWYHFTRLQPEKLLFSLPVASSTTICFMQPAKISMRCFSLSTSFTGSGIHATVHKPQMLYCVVWCTVALFWLKIRSLTLQTFAAVPCCSWRSAIPFSPWSLVVFINTFKNYPEFFYIFSAGKFINTLLATWLLSFYLIIIKLWSYSIDPIFWNYRYLIHISGFHVTN